MTDASYRSWPEPARTMARSIDAAVGAAQVGDATAFGAALGDLGRLDPEQVAILLGAITRELLERAHPDGLDSDDAELLLKSCIRSAVGWYEPLDTDPLLRALTGSLGITDPEELPTVQRPTVVAHGLLLIADQLSTQKLALTPLLEQGLAELRRAQTVELP